MQWHLGAWNKRVAVAYVYENLLELPNLLDQDDNFGVITGNTYGNKTKTFIPQWTVYGPEITCYITGFA